jgi:hypothetical protein
VSGCALFVLAAAGVAGADGLRVRLDDVQATVGERAAIPLTLEGAKGLGALQLELVFDPAQLEPIEIAAGPLGADTLLDVNVVAPGRWRIALAGAALADDGLLLRAIVRPKGDAGAEARVRVEAARAWAHATNLDVAVTANACTVRVVAAAPARAAALWPWIGGALVVVLVGIARWAVRRRRPKEGALDAP